MSIASITRIVKFIRKGKGVIIAQSSNVFSYTESAWKNYYSTNGRLMGWAGITNATDFTRGDTMVIMGMVSDKGNIPISLYTEVDSVDTSKNVVTALSRYYIMNGKDGQPGAKGERGAVMRGPQAWSDCAVGYVFQSGADGEEFKDVVMYGNNYYSCVKSHTKTADNYPTSTTDTNNGYWKLADKFEMVATKILLAQYALVKNLGVEAIDMKDSAGNIIFQAKDGNVICNSGTFNNITVKGDSTLEGIVRANLYYGKICKLTPGVTYAIDPKTAPYNCYYVENPSKATWITLPKAADYDGLEIQIFTKMAYNTSWFTEKCTYVKPQSNDDFYIKVNPGMIVKNGTQTAMSVERIDVSYVNYKNDHAMTLPNIMCRFKSIGSAWYAIEGIYTGE